MTKSGNQNLPEKAEGFHYCKSCKEWVPFEKKHNRKIHPNGAFLGIEK